MLSQYKRELKYKSPNSKYELYYNVNNKDHELYFNNKLIVKYETLEKNIYYYDIKVPNYVYEDIRKIL